MRGDERVGDERDDKRGRGVQEKSKVKKKRRMRQKRTITVMQKHKKWLKNDDQYLQPLSGKKAPKCTKISRIFIKMF